MIVLKFAEETNEVSNCNKIDAKEIKQTKEITISCFERTIQMAILLSSAHHGFFY